MSACFHVCVEGLPTEDVKHVLEKASSEWKNVSQHLADLARKIQLQEDINTYSRQLDELERAVKTKEEWLKHAPSSESPRQSLPSAEVKSPHSGRERILCPALYLRDAACLVNIRLMLV